jgi:hypothetical protein
VTSKAAAKWTIIPTERFQNQIASSFKALDDWVRKNNSLPNRELYLKKISALKAFKKFALYDAAKGPDRRFEEFPEKGRRPAFYVRSVGPWIGYCSIDKEKKTIRWDFATHDDPFF